MLYEVITAVVADAFDAGANIRTVPVQEIPEGWMVLDIGPATITLFAEALDTAKTSYNFV